MDVASQVGQGGFASTDGSQVDSRESDAAKQHKCALHSGFWRQSFQCQVVRALLPPRLPRSRGTRWCIHRRRERRNVISRAEVQGAEIRSGIDPRRLGQPFGLKGGGFGHHVGRQVLYDDEERCAVPPAVRQSQCRIPFPQPRLLETPHCSVHACAAASAAARLFSLPHVQLTHWQSKLIAPEHSLSVGQAAHFAQSALR